MGRGLIQEVTLSSIESKNWVGSWNNWSMFDFIFKRGGAWFRMLEKGTRPDQPDLAVLPPARALILVRPIGTTQASIIVVLVVGSGGIGSTLLSFLPASDVWRFTVVNHNDAKVYNFLWQVIHTKGRRVTIKAGPHTILWGPSNPLHWWWPWRIHLSGTTIWT